MRLVFTVNKVWKYGKHRVLPIPTKLWPLINMEIPYVVEIYPLKQLGQEESHEKTSVAT